MSSSLRGLPVQVAAALLLLWAAAACGEDARPPIAPPSGTGNKPGVVSPPGGGGGRSSTPSGSEAGEGGDPVSEPGAPVVQVTSPEALDDPADGSVIVTQELDVLCSVEKSPLPGAMPVDKASITLDMLDAEGELMESLAAAPTDAPGQFSAHFFLAGIEDNGRISFRCNARDTSQPPKLASQTIRTFIDKGPAIRVVEPEPMSAHPLRGAVRFEFDVTQAPLTDDDPGAAVDEVTLEVNGIPIRVTSEDGETYQAFVDFADQDVFTDIPNGDVPVIIHATNARSPEPALRKEQYSFVIDGEGPVVSIGSPRNEDVVGGQVRLQFSVRDELSGVDPDTLVIELNDKEYHYGEGGTWARANGTDYEFLFDSVQAEKDSKIQATVTIRATDEVGNSSDGESLIVYLDNVPPIVDLDPPLLVEVEESGDSEAPLYCSFPFDPVGSLSANDLQRVEDVHRMRAMVVDRTNQAPGQNILYYSGQRPDSVYVYLQADRDEPLLIDSNGDGDCDELVETRNDLPFQHLNGLGPQGASWFGSAESGVVLEGCGYLNRSQPETLCQPHNNDMTRIVAWGPNSKVPMIYAIGNLAPGPACTGTDWEMGQLVNEGWFCVAARAEDNVGNVGISRPLRLCYDDGGGVAADCDEALAPTCTDGCTVPDRNDEYLYWTH